MMNFDSYTNKSKEVLAKVQEIAHESENQIIDNGHLLKAILLEIIYMYYDD